MLRAPPTALPAAPSYYLHGHDVYSTELKPLNIEHHRYHWTFARCRSSRLRYSLTAQLRRTARSTLPITVDTRCTHYGPTLPTLVAVYSVEHRRTGAVCGCLYHFLLLPLFNFLLSFIITWASPPTAFCMAAAVDMILPPASPTLQLLPPAAAHTCLFHQTVSYRVWFVAPVPTPGTLFNSLYHTLLHKLPSAYLYDRCHSPAAPTCTPTPPLPPPTFWLTCCTRLPFSSPAGLPLPGLLPPYSSILPHCQ